MLSHHAARSFSVELAPRIIASAQSGIRDQALPDLHLNVCTIQICNLCRGAGRHAKNVRGVQLKFGASIIRSGDTVIHRNRRIQRGSDPVAVVAALRAPVRVPGGYGAAAD